MRKQHEHPVVLIDKKQCTKCKNFKIFSDFHKYSKSPDGYKHFCKTCVKEYDQIENEPNLAFPKKYNKDGKIHCRHCGEYFEESQMKQSKVGMYKGLTYCLECAPLLSHIRKVRSYGITLEQYHQMLEDQDYSCKICGLKESTYRKRLSIDHDHKCCPGTKSCGKCIRGLLCSQCNSGLGSAKDSIEILQKMIEYLSTKVL
jgi:hypothetical protein